MDSETKVALSEALALHQRGALAQAEAAYRALWERSAAPAAAQMLGTVLHQQGRSAEALAWFERAAAAPSALLHTNHAAALLAVGDAAAAQVQARRALALAPAHGGATLNLALALEAQQHWAQARELLEPLLGVATLAPTALRALVRCLLREGRAEEALRRLAAAPAGPDVATLRGEALLRTGDAAGALAAWDAVLAADPTQREACVLGAQLLLRRGALDACLARLRTYLMHVPGDATTHSFHLRCLQYAPQLDASALLAAHRDWAARHAPPAQVVATRPRRAGERLRIGWLSGAFRNGPVQTFLLPVLAALRAQGSSENLLFSTNPQRDPSSAALRAAADGWHDVAFDADAALVQRLRAVQLDVVVDLAGHAQGGRLAALAQRVAPLQATWLDSFGTTGVDAIDVVLGDPVSTPPQDAAHYCERIVALPRVRLCYAPPVPADPRPVAEQRFISLNHYAKLNDGVVAAWSAILRALPGWTLHLKAHGGDEADVVAALRARFAAQGVAPERIECSGYAALADALAAYRSAAIALDPFPFSGGANSCDALWLGLPLVTLPRDTLVSRQSAAFLHALGKDEWIARDAADYVAIACRLAADAPGRDAWRAVAATQVQATLCDAPRFARELIEALERAWAERAAVGFPA